MIRSPYYLYQAIQNVKSTQKTIDVMGDDVSTTTLAQNEMFTHEREYYREETKRLLIFILAIIGAGSLLGIGFTTLFK